MANKETTLFESIPTTWKEFEAAVERLHYRTYWQRLGKNDRLTLQQDWHDDFWKQYPHLQNLDLRYGIEVDRYVENTANLNESKKAVLAAAGDLLEEARGRVERLGLLWPALEALAGRNAGKRYGPSSTSGWTPSGSSSPSAITRSALATISGLRRS